MYSILIIEDEQRVADLLHAGLEENGYNCLVAYDGAMGAENVPRQIRSTLSFRTLCSPRWTDLNCAKRFGLLTLPFLS